MKTIYCAKFVNVYLTNRAYGGSEEGGWWFDYGTAIRSTQVGEDRLDDVLKEEVEWCMTENAERRSDVGSVLCEGRYVAYVEDEPAANYPTERPHYE